MKVSDIMLDMATGDASMDDAYIQEAVGKINVSSKIFDTAFKISELPSGDFLCVQEAAAEGMPTTAEGNKDLAIEAVGNEITALYDVILNTAKKIKTSVEKDMKLLAAIGKKNGISMNDGNFVSSFVKPLSKVLFADGKISLNDKKFLKGKYSIKLAENYGRGMGNFLSAYGLSLDNVFGDSIVSNVVSGSFNGKKNISTLKDLEKNLSSGGKLIAFDKTVDKNTHYTANISVSDFEDLATGLYAILQISKAVISTMTPAKKGAKRLVTDLCNDDKIKEKKVSRICQSLNDDIKTWSGDITNITDAITKAFGDSVYAITELN